MPNSVPAPTTSPPPTVAPSGETIINAQQMNQIQATLPQGYTSSVVNPYAPPPPMSTDVANTSKTQLYAESQALSNYYQAQQQLTNPGQPYIGPSAYSIMNAQLNTVAPTQRFIDLTNAYNQEHYNIVGSSGTLNYNPVTGGYTYGSGYSTSVQGQPFQANVLTQYQLQALQNVFTNPTPGMSSMQQLLDVPGLKEAAPSVVVQAISPYVQTPQVAQNIGEFLTNPEERKPYENWFWGAGPANAFTAMNATYLGRGTGALYAPLAGSVAERFGFDEYGKVLTAGGTFSPALSQGDIPINPKMGGNYTYVGEYHYDSGDIVSRYENSLGAFVDFTKMGVMTEPFVGVKGGGSPGAFYATPGASTAIANIPTVPKNLPSIDIGAPIPPTVSASTVSSGGKSWLENADSAVLGFLGIGAQGLGQGGSGGLV